MQERAEGGKQRAKRKVKHSTKSELFGSYKKLPDFTVGKMRYPSSVQKFNTASGNEKTKHPTQKPVVLMEYLIKTYTNENETVLDFTIGSGTTGVACVNLNRNFIGIEIKQDYFNIAEKRIKEI